MSAMNKGSRNLPAWRFWLPALLVIPALAVAYCHVHNRVGIKSFFTLYEKKATTSESRNGYRISAMVLTKEYQAVSRLKGVERPTEEELRAARSYNYDGLRILVTVAKENPTKEPGNARDDLLYASLAKGKEAFSDALHHWQQELKDLVSLEDGHGNRLKPVAYHYMRRWEFGTEDSFMFIFPDSQEGRAVSASDWKIKFKEFGLSTGNLSLQLAPAPGLRVRI